MHSMNDERDELEAALRPGLSKKEKARLIDGHWTYTLTVAAGRVLNLNRCTCEEPTCVTCARRSVADELLRMAGEPR
jgi:hypothetical protein